MDKEERKEFVNITSESLKESTLAEEKLLIDESQFINWMIGLASAGFLFLFTNLSKIRKEIIGGSELLNYLSKIVLFSFFITLIFSLVFKFSKNILLKKYMYIGTFASLQKSSLIRRIDKINIQNTSDELIVFNKISELEYLPEEIKVELNKKTNTYLQRVICRITYLLSLISFCIEYGSLFALAYHLVRV